MKINKITFTGADDQTNITKLISLSQKNPLIEWGILCSMTRQGYSRYPTKKWIKELIVHNDLNLSAHLCGKFSIDIIENKKYDILDQLEYFKRIQINYNFNNKNNHYIDELINYSFKNNKTIILQYNSSNSPILDLYSFPENFNFLYDSSAGRGIEIDEIKNPLSNYTGYAGGLNENNIAGIIKLIEKNNNPSNVWIDFESGIRTLDRFDFNKIERILSILNDPCVSKYPGKRCLKEDFEFYHRHVE